MEIVGWFFFVLFLLIGLAVIPFGIAGTFIIVADVFLYALLTDFDLITWKFLGDGVEILESDYNLTTVDAKKCSKSL